jgi:excisionase family DNA binding protein
MHQHTAAPALTFATAPEWLRLRDAAQLACVTPKTLRRWAIAGLIRVARPGGRRTLVDRDSLRAAIERAAVGPVAA